MVNTRMFVFKHPKYYTELRLRNKSDQVISNAEATAASERAPGQGQKPQASSSKPQASSFKPQAASSLIQEPRYKKTGEVFLGKGPRAFTMIKVLSGCFTWNAI